MAETTFTDIGFSNFSRFIFKENYVFIEEKDNPSEKVDIVEEKLRTNHSESFFEYIYKTIFSERIWLAKCSLRKGWFFLKGGKSRISCFILMMETLLENKSDNF